MPTVSIDGNAVYYTVRESEGDARQRVLYIHGTGCNGRVFDRHIAALPADCAAAAVDLPGHGQSGGAGYRGVADYAAAAAAVIRDLKWERTVVAGHSMGGGIALALALYDAELVHALMLIDTGARLRVAPQVINAARDIASGRRRAKPDPRQGFAAVTSNAVVANVREATADCPAEVVARDWIADDTCDFMSRLPALGMPTLALCGREDPLTPLKYHEYLAAHMPDCELVVIDGAGHWPFAEQPAAFDAAVAGFLARLPAAPLAVRLP